MPIYAYKCKICGMILEIMTSTAECRKEMQCPECLQHSAVKVFTPININVGKSSRVYMQWKGDPNKCPKDLKEHLEKMDRPKGVSVFKEENIPLVGTGDAFKEKK